MPDRLVARGYAAVQHDDVDFGVEPQFRRVERRLAACDHDALRGAVRTQEFDVRGLAERVARLDR